MFENGVKAEYKRITESSVNLGTSIQRALREGKEQAGRIVVWIDKGGLNMDEVQSGIEYALQNDRKRKIKEVILLNKEGKEVKYDKI